jgi:hypothetical protein
MKFRNCAIGASPTVLGLLLAVVMVCATAAQTPQADTPMTPPKPTDGQAPRAFLPHLKVQTVPDVTPTVPSESEPNKASGSFPLPPLYSPPDGFNYGPIGSPNRAYTPTGPGPEKAYTPSGTSSSVAPRVGRFQLTSHEGQLLLLDTTSGECWVRTGTGDWARIALPVDPNMTPVPTRHVAPL